MCESCGWQAALERIDEALGIVNEVRDACGSDAAQDFCDGVHERLLSIEEWVQEKRHVTEAQTQAVENMATAAGKWLR